ncbi:hypothetical protein PQJ75_06450 [Rhodoplanes sp. TEM]|uniref:Uncharacterized protein n=1 Tax=Rhodoplanes tepidamans TaxID=200616 RepID=A0ABT5J5Q7_RHOTP|nr:MULTISPECIES: hypothetical protein [Rhodoplanes]MDC7784370.1 hypothetical protein [Rhodoplanes tepidamans]MDC7983366.1 hypothetical protein [Rhodoplanes sp. TEM]MDQ0354501.1 hypothetical protein [Rhodoplanes tepidamans]
MEARFEAAGGVIGGGGAADGIGRALARGEGETADLMSGGARGLAATRTSLGIRIGKATAWPMVKTGHEPLPAATACRTPKFTRPMAARIARTT